MMVKQAKGPGLNRRAEGLRPRGESRPALSQKGSEALFFSEAEEPTRHIGSFKFSSVHIRKKIKRNR